MEVIVIDTMVKNIDGKITNNITQVAKLINEVIKF